MLLIKNDPKYNEQWPRALVPYKRIYGIAEPKRLAPLANDGSLSKELPEGTPFGLVGASSLFKRESYPNGAVPKDGVTAGWAGGDDPTDGYRGLDPFNTSENGASLNWFNQGAEAGRYSNDDIVAIRILVAGADHRPQSRAELRPAVPQSCDGADAHSRRNPGAEVPLTQPLSPKGEGERGQPDDPDGNPDTSFLAKIPADTAFTFQTLDKNGMVLNMAQTWHQVRPGEIRTDCGGCHAHSQKPTPFEKTAAARPDYRVFDLTQRTPLLTTKALDESGKKWDAKDETGLRFDKGIKNVEFFRDVKPILDRSCVACHTVKYGKAPAGLVLDDNLFVRFGNDTAVPGTYYRLAEDSEARYGLKPVIHNGQWRQTNASRYIRKFQSRRSLLIWKVFGRRCDGWTNEDFPTETTPGDPTTLRLNGQPVPDTPQNRDRADLDFVGSVMPPPDAVEGTYVGPDGKTVKVPALTAEDRLTLVRWIDLGCPIDLDYDETNPERRGYGWMADDQRPTLTLTYPRAGANAELSRLLVGMYDAYSGVDMDTFHVTADFALDGTAAGVDVAAKFKPASAGVWELKLDKPITALPRGKLTVSVKDRQGNVTVIERTFSVDGGP